MEFLVERDVFIREKASNMYSTLPYYFSKLALETPLLLSLPFFENILTFWGIGYRNQAFF